MQSQKSHLTADTFLRSMAKMDQFHHRQKNKRLSALNQEIHKSQIKEI